MYPAAVVGAPPEGEPFMAEVSCPAKSPAVTAPEAGAAGCSGAMISRTRAMAWA